MTDNRYAIPNRKYGAGKYGASDLQTLLYGLWIDWDGDGAYPDIQQSSVNNEAYARMTGWSSRRGRKEFLRDSDQGGFAPYETGELRLELDNTDDRYNPLNTSSPIYPNCKSGKYVYFWMRNTSGGSDVALFTGQIDEISLVGLGDQKKAIITVKDGWRKLRDDQVTIPLQTDVESEDAIDAVLTAAEWPALWGSDVGVGAETLAYWWEDARSPSAALKDLADSEYGKLTLTAAGKVRFRARTATDESVTSFTQDILLKDIQLRDPFKSIRDKVTIKVSPRVLQSVAEVWRLQDTPSVPAGGSITIWTQFSYSNQDVPVKDPINPVATTDFLANSASDGSGSNLTGDITVTMSSFGSRAKLVVANSGGSLAYITLLKVRGEAVSVPNVSYAIAGDGIRNFDLALPWQQTISLANDLSTFLLDVLADLPAAPIVKQESRPDTQFVADIGDSVAVSLEALDINSTFQIGYIEHSALDESCQRVLSTFYTEPVTGLSGDYLTVDDPTLGQLDANRLAL